MDSGNSGSLHSSSTGGGGDEEYDSRAAVSLFDVGGILGNPSPLYDPFPNFMTDPNPFLANPNTALPGPASLRSDPNPATSDAINPLVTTSPTFTPSLSPGAAAKRNPRKRSRASRRAPTTVMTTDTANFRAMVQEFTGIPSPPFNPSTRFDLYSSRSPYPPPNIRRMFERQPGCRPPFPHSSPTNSRIPPISSTIENPQSLDPSNNQFLAIPQTNSILASVLQTNPKFPISISCPMAESKPNSFEIRSNSSKIDSYDAPINPGNLFNSTPSGGLQTLMSFRNNTEGADLEGPINGEHRSFGPKNPTDQKMNHGSAGMVESWICSSSE